MASDMMKVLKEIGKHNVGSVNDWEIDDKLFAHGAKATVDIENYTLVKVGYGEDGEPTITPISANTEKGYLVCAVEQILDQYGEKLSNFYVAKGERARIVRQPEGTRFQASNFELNSGVSALKNGFVAHFDATKKKYIVSNPASAHADYDAAANKYIVHSFEEDYAYVIDGKVLVQFMAQ